jgi:GNAT superfamily N-acetyltransferase
MRSLVRVSSPESRAPPSRAEFSRFGAVLYAAGVANGDISSDVVIRPMTAADIVDGLRLCRASGWNQTARDWEQFLALEPRGARVAEIGGRVAGTVATVRYSDRFGWIGMVLVDPDRRGRGIGTRLLDEGVALLADMPLARLDATPAGYGLYLKRGFTEEYRLRRLQAVVPPAITKPRLSSARPMLAGDLPEVLALDEEVFGADRSAMLRWLWRGAPEYAWLARQSGRLQGYAFGRHGFAFEHLGPVIAIDDQAALQLVSACLGARVATAFVIDATLHSASWLQNLEELGFREQRPLIRMSRGHGRIPGDPSRQFAILGPEFG